MRAAVSGSGENIDHLKQRAKEDTGVDVTIDAAAYDGSAVRA